jgi:hypothetical protein
MDLMLEMFQQILVLFQQANFSTIFLSVSLTVIFYLIAKWIYALAVARNLSFESIVQAISKVCEFLKILIPKFNLPTKTQDILQLTLETAQIAVKYSEQMYLSGQIQSSERKEKATQIVEATLKDANIDITDERRKLIDASIESAVFTLPPKS